MTIKEKLESNWKMALIIFLSMTLAVVLLFGGRPNISENNTEHDLKIIDVEWDIEDNWFTLDGYIVNKGDTTADYIRVNIYLLDRNGDIVDCITGYCFDEIKPWKEGKLEAIEATYADGVRSVLLQVASDF